VVCEDIERSGRDTFNALKLERELSDRGIPLFATDEPASVQVQEISPVTVLVRRVKQGVAEYFRLQIKQKTWDGLVEHAISGWNIGPVPYGYTGVRVPHPVPVKASQGRTKTRLDLEPVRAQAVAQIYRWRVDDHLGIPTITTRLNAGHATFPPPDGQHWQAATVAAILANPKYTGYMVYGRRRRIPGHSRRPAYRPTRPEQWVWSEQPAHPAVITRPMFDAAQAIAAQHRSAGDDPATSAQPQARRSYPLRSRVRCRICQRRMRGVTRRSAACSARFAELHTQRQATQAQLEALEATTPQPAADLALLNDLPLAAATLGQHPGRLLAALYQAFDIQCLYKPDMHQVTIFATITTSTPATVAAIINAAGSGPAHAGTPGPHTPGQTPPPAPQEPEMYPLPQRPIEAFRYIHAPEAGPGAPGGRPGPGVGGARARGWTLPPHT
jgi:hypothetical protein